MPDLTRRQFLVGCSAAIAAMAGARFGALAWANPETAATSETLVIVFLRGGCDGLNIVPPLAGDDRQYYETKRPSLQVPASGSDAALPLDGQFGFHPACAPLHDLYQDGKLALVLAVGLTVDTRSHFDAMDYIELGTPGRKDTGTGWLARYLASSPHVSSALLLPAVAAGTLRPTALLGADQAVALNDLDALSFYGHWKYRDAQRLALRHMYQSATSWLHRAGVQTLDLVDIVEARKPPSYTPANGAVYPDTSFGNQLKVLAQLIKMEVGLHVATIDLGGWDTHAYQGDGSGGYFASLLDELARGLTAFYTDLDVGYTDRLTVVVLSEFGRRLRENANGGTDHGHGNVMMVLGNQVNGGLHGRWPGLHEDQLYDRADLAVTTDYRQVLSEIVIRRLQNPNLGAIFPGYTEYKPLGVVRGNDLPPQYGETERRVFLPFVVR
ncbi:MAG: DUF1501 domain-containing protein [Ardenticatenia bacterium]|nr:DUF1501 domain-containing protein [Ardenticatenia bacterium]